VQSDNIRQSNEDIQHLIEQHNTLCDECDALDITKASLETNITELQTQHTLLGRELQSVQNSIPLASEQVQKAHEQREVAASERLQEIQTTIDIRMAQSQVLHSEQEKLRIDSTSFAHEHDQLRQNIIDAQIQLQDLHLEHSTAKQNLLSLQNDHNEHIVLHDTETKTLHETRQNMLDTVADIQLSITQINEQKIHTQSELQALQTSLVSQNTSDANTLAASTLLAQENLERNQELAACVLAIAEKNTEFTALQTQLMLARDSHDEQQLALKQLTSASETRQKRDIHEHECARLDLEKLRVKCTQCLDTISDKEHELSEIEDEIVRKSESCLAEKKTELKDLDHALQQLCINMANKQTEYDALHTRFDDLQGELEISQKNLQRYTLDMTDKQDELSVLTIRVEETHLAASQKHATLESDIGKLHKQIMVTNTELEINLHAVEETCEQLETNRSAVVETCDQLESTRSAVAQAWEQHESIRQAIMDANIQLENNHKAVTESSEKLEMTRQTENDTNTRLENNNKALKETNEQLKISRSAFVETNERVEKNHKALNETSEQLKISRSALVEIDERVEKNYSTLAQTNEQLEISHSALTETRELLEINRNAIVETNAELVKLEQDMIQHNEEFECQIETPSCKPDQDNDSFPNQQTPHDQNEDEEFEAMLMSISDNSIAHNAVEENTLIVSNGPVVEDVMLTVEPSIDIELQNTHNDLLNQISKAHDLLLSKENSLTQTQNNITALTLEENTLDTEKINMTLAIQLMQQEIMKQKEESDLLVCSIASQHEILQNVKDTTCAVETDKKNAMLQELKSLQASIEVAEEIFVKQKKRHEKGTKTGYSNQYYYGRQIYHITRSN